MIRLPVLRAASIAIALVLVAALPASLTAQAPAAVKGDAAKARGKVAMCIGCHAISGYKASFPEVYSVPLIAGQSERYLQNALEAYRKGDRSHPTMRAIAGSLSDQDIADLAAYYAAGGATAVGSASK
jgi:cytochrome c553